MGQLLCDQLGCLAFICSEKLCFQVCCSSSFSFPEVWWRRNSNRGQVSQWQAVIADLFPSMSYLQQHFQRWTQTTVGVLTHFALMNHVSPPAHQGVHLEACATGGYLYRTINGVIWSGKKWLANITPEGEQKNLERCNHIPQSHCNLCHVENRTMLVLMMMTIVA